MIFTMPFKEKSRDNDEQRGVYKQQIVAPKPFSNFQSKNKSSFSATSILSRQSESLAYITTASREKLTCTDQVDFGEC